MRGWIQFLISVVLLLVSVYGCWYLLQEPDWLQMTDKQWKERLTEEQYRVLRQGGTEKAFTGRYYKKQEQIGTYSCAGCQQELFSAQAQFDSGTGWPSFFQPLPERLHHEQDNTFMFAQVEVLCGRCKGHLGHVFPDGPKPTGLRYCINSVALEFKPE